MTTLSRNILCGFLSAFPAAVFACDLCSVYNAPLSHGIVEQGWHLAVAEQFTHFDTLLLDGHQVPNPARQRLNSSVTQVAVGYHFTDRVGLQLNLPYIHRSFRRAEGDAVEHGTESGLGDISLSGNVHLLRRDDEKQSILWNLMAGVKFPTGSPSRLREELEEEEPEPGDLESGIHGHDLALGSGSYDEIVGSEVYFRRHRWFGTVAAQYAIRSRGEYGYRYANDLTWAGGPGAYVVYGEEWTVGLQALVSGETKSKDHLGGETAEDTAITSVFIGPRLSISWMAKLSAELSVGIPVDIQNSALQAVPDYRVQGAFILRF